MHSPSTLDSANHIGFSQQTIFVTQWSQQLPSVHLQVATGGSLHELMPMLLTVPPILHIPGHSYSLLGFGDIVIPGLLGVYTRTWDLQHQLSTFRSYFWPCLGGYPVGLLATKLELYFEIGGSQGQPALGDEELPTDERSSLLDRADGRTQS